MEEALPDFQLPAAVVEHAPLVAAHPSAGGERGGVHLRLFALVVGAQQVRICEAILERKKKTNEKPCSHCVFSIMINIFFLITELKPDRALRLSCCWSDESFSVHLKPPTSGFLVGPPPPPGPALPGGAGLFHW